MPLALELAKPEIYCRIGLMDFQFQSTQKSTAPANGYVDLIRHKREQRSRRLPTVPEYASGFFERISYLAAPYASRLNPVFLAQMTSPSIFNERPYWLIRDGLVPLALYFRANPKPGRIASTIFIEHSLLSVVPPAWRPLVHSYRLISTMRPAKLRTDLLIGAIHADEFSEHLFAERLSEIDSTKHHGSEKWCFVPSRGLGRWPSESAYFRSLLLMAEKFGPEIKPVEWPQLLFRTSFEGFRLVSLVDRRMVADCYFVHLILGRGGYVESSPLQTGEVCFPLSPYHAFALDYEVKASAYNQKLPPFDFETDQHLVPWFGEWLKQSRLSQEIPRPGGSASVVPGISPPKL